MKASISLRVPQFLGHSGMHATPTDREVLRAAMVKEIEQDVASIMDGLFLEDD